MNQIPARHKANAPTTRPPMQTIPVEQQRKLAQHSFSQQFVFLPVLVGEFTTCTVDIFIVVRESRIVMYGAEITTGETELMYAMTRNVNLVSEQKLIFGSTIYLGRLEPFSVVI